MQLVQKHDTVDEKGPRTNLPLLFLLSPGYSEEGGAQTGDVIPEHEFAESPVCLDDENEFPPVGNQSN